MKLKAGRRITR